MEEKQFVVREYVPVIAELRRRFLTKRQRWLSHNGKSRVRKKWRNVFLRKLEKYKNHKNFSQNS